MAPPVSINNVSWISVGTVPVRVKVANVAGSVLEASPVVVARVVDERGLRLGYASLNTEEATEAVHRLRQLADSALRTESATRH